jgi:hypothetical protein
MANITSLQETSIRRINRKFQIERRGNLLTARLSVNAEITIKDGMQERAFNRVLTVENVGNAFRVTSYTQTTRKRLHWRKWRNVESGLQTFSGNNFYKLIDECKKIFAED